ncbi:MAG: DUF4367 domain-containing protein, partial [Eubacterium sp.]|nr:DUF4367 domain-containing protein [Eubacterium sp.]
YYEYWNYDKYIIISKYTLDNRINFDTETSDYKEILIDNIKYISYTSNTNSGIVWNSNGYLYAIEGNISNDELLQIAIKIK